MPKAGVSIFEFLTQPPAETYADHLVLEGGWVELEPEDQAQTPWMSHGLNGYHVGVEIDYMTQFVQEAFRAFGGTAVSRVLEFSTQELEDYFEEYDNQERFGVYCTEGVFLATHRFLSGQSSDEECQNLLDFPR